MHMRMIVIQFDEEESERADNRLNDKVEEQTHTCDACVLPQPRYSCAIQVCCTRCGACSKGTESPISTAGWHGRGTEPELRFKARHAQRSSYLMRGM